MNAKLGLLSLSSVLLLAACGTSSTPSATTPTKPSPTTPAPTNPAPAKPLSTPTGAYYLQPDGTQVTITQEMLQDAGTRFVFYAWLEDEQGGINAANIGGADFADPGAPTESERIEVAPSQTQNLAGGYVGYRGDNGQIYPVVGAGVRWDIVDTGPTTVQFAAADDGGQPSGANYSPQDINDRGKSAWTVTNSATMRNVRFPSSPANPLYNQTGVGTPDRNGFTWTALFSPAAQAQAQITAIAYINGTEVAKQFLNKSFAPTAALRITKTVDAPTAGLNEARNFTITVTNTGLGPASRVTLSDVLNSGNASAYSATAPAGTIANDRDGFDAQFDLQPGESRTFTLPAQASATGVYCDVVRVVSYDNGAFGTVNPSTGTLQAEACVTVIAPELAIVKSLVDAQGNVIANNQTVSPDQPVYARITVVNRGTAPATNVVVTDELNTSNGVTGNYRLTAAPVANPTGVATTANASNRGFTTAPFNLAVGASQSFTLTAAATANGQYCDIASYTSTNGNPNTNVSENVCFTVVSPVLNITKVNTAVPNGRAIEGLLPGDSYNSVISVSNTGTGAATSVALSDLLGRAANGTPIVNFGSGTFTVSTGSTVNQTGSVVSSGGTVTTNPATVSLNPGQTLTLNVVSTIPAGAPAGEYCDVGSYTSANGGNGQARACVNVLSFISQQTQLVDQIDPIRAGDTNGTVLTSNAIVELSSNEAAINNAFTYNYGTLSPLQTTPGVFNFDSTGVYYDPTPIRDPQTGAVISDYTNSTSRQLVVGTDYTTSAASGTGQQTIRLTPTFAIQPGAVVIVRTKIFAPAGTAARQYNSTFYWTNTAQRSGTAQENFKAESTTVVP